MTTLYTSGGILIVVLLVLLLGAVITDLSDTRIPNLFILIGLIAGVFYRIFGNGERNYLHILLGILIPFFIFFPLFVIRAMGAGDIKLFMMTGTFFTIGENIKCIVIAVLLGGIIAAVKVLIYRNLGERIRCMWACLKTVYWHAVVGNTYEIPYMDSKDKEMIKTAGIKFSLPILLAAIIVMGGRV